MAVTQLDLHPKKEKKEKRKKKKEDTQTSSIKKGRINF